MINTRLLLIIMCLASYASPVSCFIGQDVLPASVCEGGREVWKRGESYGKAVWQGSVKYGRNGLKYGYDLGKQGWSYLRNERCFMPSKLKKDNQFILFDRTDNQYVIVSSDGVSFIVPDWVIEDGYITIPEGVVTQDNTTINFSAYNYVTANSLYVILCYVKCMKNIASSINAEDTQSILKELVVPALYITTLCNFNTHKASRLTLAMNALKLKSAQHIQDVLNELARS